MAGVDFSKIYSATYSSVSFSCPDFDFPFLYQGRISLRKRLCRHETCRRLTPTNQVPVYEFKIDTDSVMRRRADDWINATHILKVAGFDKPARTRILEREVQKGVHEKVQGGYGKYQGKRGRSSWSGRRTLC